MRACYNRNLGELFTQVVANSRGKRQRESRKAREIASCSPLFSVRRSAEFPGWLCHANTYPRGGAGAGRARAGCKSGAGWVQRDVSTRRFLLQTARDGILFQFGYRRLYHTGRTRSWNLKSSTRVSLVIQRVPRVFRPFSHTAWLCVSREATLASSIFLSACQNVILTRDPNSTLRRVKNIKVPIWLCQRRHKKLTLIRCSFLTNQNFELLDHCDNP